MLYYQVCAHRCLESISALGLAVLLLLESQVWGNNLYNNLHPSCLYLPGNYLPNTSHISEHILDHSNTSQFSIYCQLIAHTGHLENNKYLTDQQKHELNIVLSHTCYTAKAN